MTGDVPPEFTAAHQVAMMAIEANQARLNDNEARIGVLVAARDQAFWHLIRKLRINRKIRFLCQDSRQLLEANDLLFMVVGKPWEKDEADD